MTALTNDQRAVLAHVVVDPDQWWTHCQAALGERAHTALRNKVARWRASYESARTQSDYEPRAAREARASRDEAARKIQSPIVRSLEDRVADLEAQLKSQ